MIMILIGKKWVKKRKEELKRKSMLRINMMMNGNIKKEVYIMIE